MIREEGNYFVEARNRTENFEGGTVGFAGLKNFWDWSFSEPKTWDI